MLDSQIHAGGDHTETGSSYSLKGEVVVLKKSTLAAGFGRQPYYYMDGSGANVNALGKSVFLVNLKSGELKRCVRDHVLGVLKPELLSNEEKPQLSQIRPPGALSLECHGPQYSEFSFLEGGRYAAGVRLCNEKEVMEHVEIQKPYQHQIILCNRNDPCVWEVWNGRQIYPTQEASDQMHQGLEGSLGPIQI